MSQLLQRCFVFGLLFFAITRSGDAQVVQNNPAELRGVDIEEHLGDHIPLDLEFVNESGEKVELGQYFNQGKPVLLVLAYYNCPMLCTLVLNGVVNGIQPLRWLPGKEFQIITVSIDPRETPELATAKKQRYLESLGKTVAKDGWVFLVGAESQSRTLADAIGFQYYYDNEKQQYAHPAAVYLLAPDGKISRYLYGIEFKAQDLRLGLLEASQGKIGNTIDRLILYCYHYDPDARGYTVLATNVMKLGGVITLVLLAIFMAVLWAKERHT